MKVRSGYPSAICVSRPVSPAVLPIRVSGYPVLFVLLFIQGAVDGRCPFLSPVRVRTKSGLELIDIFLPLPLPLEDWD